MQPMQSQAHFNKKNVYVNPWEIMQTVQQIEFLKKI